jgi:DNA-directed RNA polymerase specialized sigma subunit
MNPLEIAKEAISIASNAGLKKDVIDLLDKKVSLLAEENIALKSEVASLNRKVADLEQQLDRFRPKTSGLDETSERFLQLLFGKSMTISEVAATLNISKGMAEYHRDVLKREKMIALPAIVTMGRENPYHLLEKGRGYLVKNKLV